jgi:ornithine cyclodeaminase/alanine dehydrogenase-like protein (mu-crystallin family)
VRVLTDEDVRRTLTPRIAVDAARGCLIEAYRGTLSSPPRLHADVGSTHLVFTVGGFERGATGFRVYGTWPGDSDQAVLVWNERGDLLACVVGSELGARRTGALGGAAVDALAGSGADEVAVIGSGRQAWTQMWALSAVRTPLAVRVFSPNPAHRERFAARVTAKLGLPAAAVESGRDAVRGAGIVILATTSRQPVIDADWIERGTHLNTVGPKTRSAHETPPELVDAAAVAVSDSPVQAAGYADSFFTDRELEPLGAFIGGRRGRRTPDDITVYCSTGLAGSEVAVAVALLENLRD